VQKPRPPVLIAGGGEQMTLRAVARLADACNVGGDLANVKHKLAVLRGHCDAAQRDYDTIERTHYYSWLLARDEAAVAAKRERLSARGPLRGFVGTVSEAIDLVGQFRDAGVQLLINSDYRNDMETLELLVSEVMPHFN
jgi:alkanesulfonate monooxygenase SsuD/methylene tetrahydromethanopterin reductase-like flavin-dependent oxidoreductase (luciferase family)